jgi:LmbE family N-acetylglucosaminyl deacetylase
MAPALVDRLNRVATQFIERLCAGADDLRPMPATAVIVAHPDDEVIGAGARLLQLRRAAFVHLTDGAPRDLRDATAMGFATRLDYAQARRRELIAGLALAGIAPEQMHALGYVDQEAALHLAEASRHLAVLLRDLQPEVVVTLPYEGGHPDHDATAFAVHAACRLLERQGPSQPALVEMTSYHQGPTGIAVYEFLPCAAYEATTRVLSEAERAFKRRLLDCFPTQRQTLGWFPIEVERFRPAPRYDFARPPHEGPPFYEAFPWGMTGARFQGLTRQAMEALGITGDL